MKTKTLGYVLGALALGSVAFAYNAAAQDQTGTSPTGTSSTDRQPATMPEQTTPVPGEMQPTGNRQNSGERIGTQDTLDGTVENGRSVSNTNRVGTAAGMSDRQLRRTVRRAILDDKALSSDAHNVKVATKNGRVTLKGTVITEEERSNIGAKAMAIAGDGNVTNDITVKVQ
ncbi:MAG: BON domain-containing protein [Elusimicrobia bacterium]|nr:BON domain-containing protein [Elusimicrobiota bacterium]